MQDKKKKVSVCLTPGMVDLFKVEESIVVVIDVLRATSCMCVAFDYGVEKMVPVESIEECLAYREKGYLVAGERNGEMVEGFDFGNSPFSYMNPKLAGRSIAISTTNGTQAIHAVAPKAIEVVIGSFANISVLGDYLLERNEHTILLCSGWKNRVNLEDTIFAGALVKRLKPHFKSYEDTALIAETLFRAANFRKRFYLRNSSHFQRLMHLNLQKDVKYCLRRDTHNVLPVLKNGELVNILKK
jgi:2-phosphosulfolactate phosphatase